MQETFIDRYPEIIAIGIAIVGIVAAGLLASWFSRLLQLLESGVARFSPIRAEQLAAATPRRILERVVYFATLIFFLLLAIRFLGIEALGEGLDAILAFLPRLLLGAIIIIGGYLLGILSFSAVSRFVEGSLVPRLAQIVVVVTAIMTGLQQMEVDVSFVTNVLVILLATTLGGMAIAFGLGSQGLVANLLAKRNLDRYRVGDTIRIAETEGTIIEFTRTGVAVQTADGIVNVPAQRFVDSIVTVIRE